MLGQKEFVKFDVTPKSGPPYSEGTSPILIILDVLSDMKDEKDKENKRGK